MKNPKNPFLQPVLHQTRRRRAEAGQKDGRRGHSVLQKTAPSAPAEGLTTSPFSLSLLHSAKNKRFSTLRCTKTGSTQPKLSAACFVVQSCLTDADFVVFTNYCLIGTRLKGVRSFFEKQSSSGRKDPAKKSELSKNAAIN